MKPEEELLEEVVEPESKFKKYTSIGIVLAVILGLAGFGLFDFVSGGSDYIIKVEDKKITPNAFNKALMMQKRQYIYRFGSGIIEGFLNSKDFFSIAVQSMADGLLISKMLEDNGVVVNKTTVNEFILNAPNFKDVEGNFDRTFFQTYLAQMGITEEDYIQEQISTIQTKFFTELISLNNFIEQEEIAKKIIMHEKQQRAILVQQIPIKEEDNIKIEEKEILSYYIKNKERFAIDEKKNVLIAKIDENILPTNFISSDDLLAEYNKEYLYKNQKISFYRLSFNTIEEAKFAENLIKKEGLSFTEVAKESLNLKANDIYFKNVLFADLNPEFMEAVASLKKFETSKVFFSNGFYNIIKLEDVASTTKIPSFESVKTSIANKLKKATSCNLVQKKAEEIGRELDSGEDLEEALKGVAIKQIKVSKNEDSLLPKNILHSILNDTDTYYAKILQNSNCEFYAYKITSIEDKYYTELEKVKDVLISEIKQEKAKNNTLLKASNIYAESVAGRQTQGKIYTIKFDNNIFSNSQIKQIWEMKQDEFLPPTLSKDEKNFEVIKLIEIQNINPNSISKYDLEAKIKSLKEDQRDKLTQYFLTELRNKYKVRINYAYIQSNLKEE